MKTKIFLMSALTLMGVAANAQELAKVISSVQVMQQVAVPHQVCNQETVAVQGNKSGAGALMGAIAGGAVGHQMGSGSGKAAATALGLFGGAILGDKIEGAPAPQATAVQNCRTETVYENRVVGYNVTYEYAGKQYMVQMPRDPGATVQVNVTPVIR